MEKTGKEKVDRMKKFLDRIYGFADIMRTDVLFRYNFVKVVLIAALLIFVVFLLGGNTGSSRSAEEIAKSVVPDLMQAENAESPYTGGEDGQDGGSGQTGENTGVFDGMGQGTVLDFKRIFGLNAEDYEGVVYFKPISQMDVEELLKAALKKMY